ncbi:MAG: DUF4493 domain-containing protein [Muribaculaceae bacterium]|nr:DUF4493 domain-containing protein [Muribaculaceae bacterium]
MKLYKGIFCSLATAALLTGCANEAPFVEPTTPDAGLTGTLMTRCLAPKLTNVEGVETSTRADVPSTDDFTVVISRKNNTRDASSAGSVEYTYSEMPEVLTLPVGDYKVYAHHGEDLSAAWDSPYYYGESEFGIDANKITDDVDPIVAKLSNIRVTIVFHPSLLSAMSGDANKVQVNVGNQGVMNFVPTETRSAYFKYVNQSQTLAATFDGIVDGAHVVETKTHDNVAPGNHYRITFRMYGIDDDKPGTVDGKVTVDASVEQVDMNHTIPGEQGEIITNPEDWRPSQGNGDEPGPGPDDPTPVEQTVPQITAAPAPSGMTAINLDEVNEVTDNIYCVLNVVSTAEEGIEEFNVVIDSGKLTPDELAGVGLSDKLDLVNPGELEGALNGLGLPANVGGMKSVTFNITGFMPMLGILGEGDHNFTLTVKDANGESTVTLRLHTN